MTSSRGGLQYRPLRAPQEHGAILIDPPLHAMPERLAENISRVRNYRYDCQGRSLDALSEQARRELLDAAAAYTSAYRDVAVRRDGAADVPVLLAGHQPELYHPGVWFKNFALSAAACRLKARAVNLLIDNDTISTAAIRVPKGNLPVPTAAYLAFDRATQETPYEERTVQDAALFESFGRRVHQALEPWIPRPLSDELWPLAIEAARRHPNLGRSVSQARHRLEEKWGLATWELPFSELCRREPFRWFVVHVLAQLPRFQEVHNTCLAEYRRLHRLRSRTHPVPPLIRQDEWLESPFWVWTVGTPRRRRLFARLRGREMELSDFAGWNTLLALNADRDGETSVGQLAKLEAAGVRLRPRALLTTMFARLVAGDLFVHGIGGAKYDQLTDQIVQQFFRFSPPTFFVVTATARLPMAPPPTPTEDSRRIDRLLRELRYNPQRHTPRTELTEPWLAAKAQWIQQDKPCHDRQQRHREVEQINEALQPFVESERRRLMHQREQCAARRKQERILGSREYSFCLFPKESLRFLLLDF